MLLGQAVGGIQTSGSRVSALQEQLSSGRRINRASDDPSGAAQAMRLRTALSSVDQYARNAGDGASRLGLIDSALDSTTKLVSRARDLALQGANSGATGLVDRNALATEIDSIRGALLDEANSTLLTRPIFGGTTAGRVAFDDTGAFVGDGTPITRQVSDDIRISVGVDGRSVFGEGADSAFAELDSLSAALRGGDDAAVQAGLDKLAARLETVNTARATAGTSLQRLEQAQTALTDRQLSLKTSLSDLEDIDVPRTLIDLSLSQVAYQTALSSAARVVQPSLIDFLR